MTQEAEYRKERIDRLLHELKYEITRGMMEQEIDEIIGFEFIVPVSQSIKDGVIICKFETTPMPHYHLRLGNKKMNLKLVE